MIQPPSTPCSFIHRGTLSSRVAAQITCVRPNRIKTEPWACGATPGSITTSRRSEAPLPSRRSMKRARLGPPRHGCKHLRTRRRHAPTDRLDFLRPPLTAFETDRTRYNEGMVGPARLSRLPSHPSGSAIRLAPALFRAPRVAVELRSNLAGRMPLGKGMVGPARLSRPLPIGLCHLAGARTLSRSARRSRTEFEPRRAIQMKKGMVGPARFELAASSSRTRRSTKLSHGPTASREPSSAKLVE